jgi:hypothetical protein
MSSHGALPNADALYVTDSRSASARLPALLHVGH